MWGISCLATELLASQEELCSMQLVWLVFSKCSVAAAHTHTIHTRTHRRLQRMAVVHAWHPSAAYSARRESHPHRHIMLDSTWSTYVRVLNLFQFLTLKT